MGIEQSLEKKEAIVKEFGWDLTGDSPDNPRSKFFFEADAEKIMIFLEKDKLVIQQLEASLKESQDKVAQWITDYDELESENHRIQSRLQEAEKELADHKANHNTVKWTELLNKRMDQIGELEKDVERLRKYEPVEPFIVVDGKKIPYSPDEVSRLREELKCWENDSGLTKELRFKELESELAKRNALIEELKLEIERIEKEKHERMDAFVESMKRVEDLKSESERLKVLYETEFNACKSRDEKIKELEARLVESEKELIDLSYAFPWNPTEYGKRHLTPAENAVKQYRDLQAYLEKHKACVEALEKVKDCHEEGSIHLGVRLYGYVLNALASLEGDKLKGGGE